MQGIGADASGRSVETSPAQGPGGKLTAPRNIGRDVFLGTRLPKVLYCVVERRGPILEELVPTRYSGLEREIELPSVVAIEPCIGVRLEDRLIGVDKNNALDLEPVRAAVFKDNGVPPFLKNGK